MGHKISSGSKVSKITIHIILGLLALFCLLPLIFVISISFSNEKDIIRNGYAMFPRVFSLEAYKMLLKEPGQLLQSYSVTIFISVVGSISALTISSMIGYVLTRKDFKASKIITSWPSLIKSPAHVRPAGPAPITAIFLPVFAAISDSGSPFSRA